ncbi:MAG: hypothetical protein IT438_10735 [Phycisphaerales bacterium]|nr:hypothetical protein [Phycisphaerales bacterium]
MRTARSVWIASVLVGVCGAAVSARAASIDVIACTGPNVGSIDASGAPLTLIEHASASPNGHIVVVGRRAGTSTQSVWVRSPEGAWARRIETGATTVAGLSDGRVTGALLGVPVVNDQGDVMIVAPVTSGAATPALARFAPDGTSRLLLRFNASTGPGVPSGGPVSFMGSSMDSWRLNRASSVFSSRNVGMFGNSAMSSFFTQLTAVVRDGVNGAPPGGSGTALSVSSSGDAATSASGYTAQRISTGAYGREDLSGMVVFNPYGVGSLAVRDRATPIEGQLDRYVLSSTPMGIVQDPSAPGSRIGINSTGEIAFVGRYGAVEQTTGSTNPSTGPIFNPTAGTMAILTKVHGRGARVVAEAVTSGAPGLPGLEGYRFVSFGSPMLNTKGQVAFTASIGGPGGSATSIWTTDPNGQLRLIAMTGVTGGPGAPPADLGGVFTSIATTPEPSINRNGQVTFTAYTTSGLTLMAFDPSLGLCALARNGRVVALPNGGTGHVQMTAASEIGGRPLLSTGNDDGLPTLLTDTGRAILRASVTNLGAAVLSIEIPTVRGGCCVGSTCEVRALFDCSSAGTVFVGDNTMCSPTSGCCIADFDHNALVSTDDLFSYIDSWIGRETLADSDMNGSVTLNDLTTFIGSYVTGCR